MMTLTKTAQEAVRGIVTESPELPDETAGLRLFGERDPAGGVQMKVAAAELPAEDDQVIEEGGARLFLDAKLAPGLEDKALDAEMGAQGVEFKIVAQS